MGEEDAKELGLDSEEEEIPKQSDKEPIKVVESDGVPNDTEKSKWTSSTRKIRQAMSKTWQLIMIRTTRIQHAQWYE